VAHAEPGRRWQSVTERAGISGRHVFVVVWVYPLDRWLLSLAHPCFLLTTQLRFLKEQGAPSALPAFVNAAHRHAVASAWSHTNLVLRLPFCGYIQQWVNEVRGLSILTGGDTRLYWDQPDFQLFDRSRIFYSTLFVLFLYMYVDSNDVHQVWVSDACFTRKIRQGDIAISLRQLSRSDRRSIRSNPPPQ
jgi:hypothetical protein